MQRHEPLNPKPPTILLQVWVPVTQAKGSKSQTASRPLGGAETPSPTTTPCAGWMVYGQEALFHSIHVP